MHPGEWGAAEWSAFGSLGSLFIATVVGGFVAIQVLQAKRVRQEQTRPYVILDFEFNRIFVELVVRNIGSTPARDVAVSVDPPFQPPNDRREGNNLNLFAAPIPMMAPGRQIRLAFGDAHEIFGEDVVLPLRYEVSLSYRDLDGESKYVDPTFVLDLQSYKWTLMNADRPAEIAEAIKGIERSLGKWNRRSGRLVVETVNGDRLERRGGRREFRWQVAQVRRERGLTGAAKWLLEHARGR